MTVARTSVSAWRSLKCRPAIHAHAPLFAILSCVHLASTVSFLPTPKAFGRFRCLFKADTTVLLPAGGAHGPGGAALEKCGHRAGTGGHHAQVSRWSGRRLSFTISFTILRRCEPASPHTYACVQVPCRTYRTEAASGGAAGLQGSRWPEGGRTCCPPSFSTPRSRPPTPASPPRPHAPTSSPTLAFGAEDECAMLGIRDPAG